MGVRQALHVFSPEPVISANELSRYLAKDEMTKITDNKWDEEVWGAATSQGTNDRDTANSNLTFYWGKKVFHARAANPNHSSNMTPGQLGSQPYQRRFDSSSQSD